MTRCEKCFTFFDKMQRVLHFFVKLLKMFQFFYYDDRGVSIFSTKRENCLYFGQDESVSSFFAKMQEIIVSFY